MDLLLSIDLGQVNSSYALIDIDTERIIKWSLIHFVDNNKQTYEKVCTNMMLEFDKLELTKRPETHKGPAGRSCPVPGPLAGTESVTDQIVPTVQEDPVSSITIIIELQPKCNVKTTVMAGQVQMYFVMQKYKNLADHYPIKKIIGYHAGNKLKYYVPIAGDPVIKTDYKNKHYKNKQIAKQHAAIILKRKESEHWINHYASEKKKDDLADSYLMALAYIKFEIKKGHTGANKP
jgi:hypothetical protein